MSLIVLNLCSVYIPANSSLSLSQLKKTLADQLSTPFIIMHKFNAHTTLWGSKTSNDKRKKILSQGDCASLMTVLVHIVASLGW